MKRFRQIYMCRHSLSAQRSIARFVLCALACLLPLVQSAGFPPASTQLEASEQKPSAWSRQGRLMIFEEVWETIAARYYDPQLRGVDWQAQRAKFRPLAAEASTEADFYSVLRRMIARLADPHTRVYAPEENAVWSAPRFVATGLSVREMAGELVVVRVERDSEAARAGVRAGDAVTNVDGEAVQTILARRLEQPVSGTAEQTSANSMAARLLVVSRLFDGPADTTVPVVFRNAAGREISALLKRRLRTRTPELSTRRIERGFHLIRFNIFTPTIAAQFARALGGDLREARGLIIDLRENGGGESEAMTDIASIFLGGGEPLGKFTNRKGRTEIEPHTRSAMLSSADSLPRSRVPLIVLTSARTASASEVLVAALREHGRARLLGETTCGCVLGIRRRHTLADGGALDISEMDFHTARGARLEGAGIRPDESITPTRQDIRTGRDRAIERAVEILKTTATED